MMPRSQIAALAILIVTLGVVLALVGSGGMKNDVFLAEDTPTPLPPPNAANWSAAEPGAMTYVDPNLPAQIIYQTVSLDELIELTGFERPAADDPDPLTTLVGQLRASLEDQITQAQLAVEPGALSGPTPEVIGGLNAVTMRVIIAPQEGAGGPFPGLDLERMLIQQADGQLTIVDYALRGEFSPVPYADYRVWLAQNVAQLPAMEEPVSAEPTPAAPDATPGAEATPAADATPEPDATSEAAEPGVVATEAAAEPTEKWLEVTQGQVVYVSNPSAAILYFASATDEFVQSLNLELAAGEPTSPLEEVMTLLYAQLEKQLQDEGISLEGGSFEGPITEDLNGVPFIYVRLTFQTQTVADGTELPGQETVLGVLDQGENRVTAIRFAYQGEADPAIYADFREWLNENSARLSALEIEEPAAETSGPEPEPTAE
jgi:hypothetical protein